MIRRVTLQDVARKLGVHHSTVSRALRSDRRIPVKTRERILKAARKLHYRPDPMLSALAAYRASHSEKKYQATLGWITNYPTRDGWRAYERVAYFKGATRRAAELGYVIEEFWLREPGLTQARLARILRARNIHGLFFVAEPQSRPHLSRLWSSFPAITFGRNQAQPTFHNVNNDHFCSFALLMRKLRRLGYRRPGLAIWPSVHEGTDRAWAASFWAHQSTPVTEQVPLFMQQPWTRAAFKAWFFKYRPDVVISHDETLLEWLESWKIKVPGQVGFALTAKHAGTSPRCSGIDENSDLVARTAVDILVGMISRGIESIGSTPFSMLVEGRWMEGSTLHRMKVR